MSTHNMFSWRSKKYIYLIYLLSGDIQRHSPFDSPRKMFFAWCLILNENILFWLTISYQITFVFLFLCFVLQICILKLNLWPKIGLTYAISIVKWFFGIFVCENMFYFSFLILNYWCLTTILWQFHKKWTSGTYWKSASNLPTLQISAYKFAFIFTMGKVKIFDFLKTND